MEIGNRGALGNFGNEMRYQVGYSIPIYRGVSCFFLGLGLHQPGHSGGPSGGGVLPRRKALCQKSAGVPPMLVLESADQARGPGEGTEHALSLRDRSGQVLVRSGPERI